MNNLDGKNISLEKCPALVLNADYRPLSYYPLSLWSWQDSIKSVFLDRVVIVNHYDRVIRSPSFSMKLPSVIALKSFIKPQSNPNFTRFNVFLRDKFSCQYCGSKNDLTFDHLLPRSKGGKTDWDNVVTACSSCNVQKGGRLLRTSGMKLNQFYVGYSICTPSRAALLTGRLPVQTGMFGSRSVLFPDNAGGLDPKEVTIASALKDYDYNTACIGKWHLGHLEQYMPLNHGFDSFFGIPYSNDMRPESSWDYARENFPPLPFLDGSDTLGISLDQSNFIEMFTQRSIEFIRENKNDPFFLYLAHTAPHTPLILSKKTKSP